MALFVLLVLTLELWSNRPNAANNVCLTVGGVLYIPFSLWFLIAIRRLDSINFKDFLSDIYDGGQVSAANIHLGGGSECAFMVMSLLFSVWICDSAAYFVGKNFGKHKLFERVSPNKTWEGAFGGFLGGVGGFICSTAVLIPDFPLYYSAILGAVIGTVGQIGDLAESLIKRDAGVKDSSALIPGHGGALDRFDSIIFVAPPIFFALAIFMFAA